MGQIVEIEDDIYERIRTLVEKYPVDYPHIKNCINRAAREFADKAERKMNEMEEKKNEKKAEVTEKKR